MYLQFPHQNSACQCAGFSPFISELSVACSFMLLTVPHCRAALAAQFQHFPPQGGPVYKVTRHVKVCATTPDQSEASCFQMLLTVLHLRAALDIWTRCGSESSRQPHKVLRSAETCATAYNASTHPRTCSTYLGLGDSFPEWCVPGLLSYSKQWVIVMSYRHKLQSRITVLVSSETVGLTQRT